MSNTISILLPFTANPICRKIRY